MLEADISLSLFQENLKSIKSKIGRASLCLVIKADAYGHGMEQIARAARGCIDEFAVATLQEAVNLENLGLKKPIVLLENTDLKQVNLGTMSDIIPVICQIDDILRLPCGIKRVSVKINSGMNRLGARVDELKTIFKILSEKGVLIHSIFTHFYDGKSIVESKKQLKVFFEGIKLCANSGVKIHASASSVLDLTDVGLHLDMVRCGIASYGYSSITKPIMQIHTDILQVYEVEKGEHIGYGDFVTDKTVRVAIIRIGYADGYRRREHSLNKERFVSIEGVLCPVLGQICMDLTAVDVSKVKLKDSSRAYVLGNGVSGESLAESCGTIVYEILTSFNKERIKRNYFF